MAVWGHQPKSARLITALPPDTIDIPSVCTKRNIGYAHTEPLSRTQVLNWLCCSHARKFIMSLSVRVALVARALIDQITQRSQYDGDAEHNGNNRHRQPHPSPRPRQ